MTLIPIGVLLGDMNIEELEISNVLLYIGDAVRFDSLDDRVDDLGVTFKTISQSIHTPTSFASMLTGCIPPRTNVYWFRDRLPEDLDTLFNLSRHNCDFVHTDSALERTQGGSLAKLLKVGTATKESLVDFEEPFVWVERGPGGHAPYGHEPMKSAKEYWDRTLPASEETLKSEYRGAIRRDYKVFSDRLDTLKDHDLLEETLIIYASDHGEALTEHGILGHNGPIRPEVVYTPTVFIHPDLEDYYGGVIRNIDLYPTIRSLLGYSEQRHPDGTAIWNLKEPIRGTVHYSQGFDITRNYGSRIGVLDDIVDPTFDQHALFDETGGYAKRFNSDAEQLGIALGNLSLSSLAPQYRRTPLKTFSSFMKQEWTCGLPAFDSDEALSEIVSARDTQPFSESSVSDVRKEELEHLGYL